MYCKNCEKEFPVDEKICPDCGNALVKNADAATTLATTIFLFAVIGAGLSLTGWLSFIGIVLCVMAFFKANEYKRTYGALTGKANIGYIISIAGIGCGVVYSLIALAILLYFAFIMLLGVAMM